MNNASKGQILLQHADVQWPENKKSIEANHIIAGVYCIEAHK